MLEESHGGPKVRDEVSDPNGRDSFIHNASGYDSVAEVKLLKAPASIQIDKVDLQKKRLTTNL